MERPEGEIAWNLAGTISAMRGGYTKLGGIHVKKTLITTAIATLALGAAFASPASAQDKIGACLITKTDTNPFFVKMKEGATAKAEELGIELKSFAGKIDGDHETQVAAIETCIADGAKGILAGGRFGRSRWPRRWRWRWRRRRRRRWRHRGHEGPREIVSSSESR